MAIAEIALQEVPTISRSTDWFLDQAWKFGLYGPSITAFGWDVYKAPLIVEDENQRPHYYLEIKAKNLSRLNDGGFGYSGHIMDNQLKTKKMKLKLSVQNKTLRDCLERGVTGHYESNTLLFRQTNAIDKKYGHVIDVILVKTCFGRP